MMSAVTSRRALLCLGGVVLAVAASELLLRLVLGHDRFVNDFDVTSRPDPVLLRANVPDSAGHSRALIPEDGFDVHYRYDKHGMRGNNDFLDEQRPDHTIPRVMLVGDSYIEQRHLGDADLIQTQLERVLSQGRPSRPHVFAYGVSGWSPLNYALYYKTQARGYRPDILFVFLTFNDYRDDSLAGADCRFSAAGELLACPATVDDYKRAIHRAEPSSLMLLDLSRYLIRTGGRWHLLRERLRTGTYREDGRDELLRTLDANQMDAILPIVRRSFDVLRQLFDQARTDGVKPVLVIIPWPHQVGAQEFALGRVEMGIPVNRLEPSTGFQDLTVKVAREAGIDTLDLLPALRDQSARDRMFFPYDGHFTAAAARSIAAVLSDAVIRMVERPEHTAR